MKLLFLLAVLIPFTFTTAQTSFEEDIQSLFQNARKGLYWALNNIPLKKNSIDNDLIADDKLYASVKLVKEVNGVKIKSTGFFNSNELTITVYRSYDSLEKEGYIRKGSMME